MVQPGHSEELPWRSLAYLPDGPSVRSRLLLVDRRGTVLRHVAEPLGLRRSGASPDGEQGRVARGGQAAAFDTLPDQRFLTSQPELEPARPPCRWLSGGLQLTAG